MRKFLPVVGALVALSAIPGSCQTFTPVINSKAADAPKCVALVSYASIDNDIKGIDKKSSPLFAVDYAVTKDINVGGAYSIATQGLPSGNLDTKLSEGHVTWVFDKDAKSAFGLTAGAMSYRPKGYTHADWAEVGLVASVKIGDVAKTPWTLGLHTSSLTSRSNGKPLFKADDGYQFGGVINYKVTKLVSVNVSAVHTHLDSVGININNYALGAAFSF